MSVEWTRQPCDPASTCWFRRRSGGRWSGRADVVEKKEGCALLVLQTVDASWLASWPAPFSSSALRRLARTAAGATRAVHVVSPRSGFEPESFRVEDYLAYYRWVRRRLESAVEEELGSSPYPEPVPHCDLCRWWPRCDRKRHEDDHLSTVAGISRLQRRELESRKVVTLESLAQVEVPLTWSPRRGTRQGYERVRQQARVQLEGRREGRRLYELLPLATDQGLARLPEPSSGDLFLDLEGDPYVGDHGLEYLFGLAFLGSEGEPVYVCEWATDSAEEKAASNASTPSPSMDRDRLHVFHYTPTSAALSGDGPLCHPRARPRPVAAGRTLRRPADRAPVAAGSVGHYSSGPRAVLGANSRTARRGWP